MSDSTVQTRKTSSVSGGSLGENRHESFTTKTVSITNSPPIGRAEQDNRTGCKFLKGSSFALWLMPQLVTVCCI